MDDIKKLTISAATARGKTGLSELPRSYPGNASVDGGGERVAECRARVSAHVAGTNNLRLMLARFALAVERLARVATLVPTIVKDLNCSEDEVLEVMRMLAVPMPHEPDPRSTAPSDANRAELMDRVPKKWQERYAKRKTQQ